MIDLTFCCLVISSLAETGCLLSKQQNFFWELLSCFVILGKEKTCKHGKQTCQTTYKDNYIKTMYTSEPI